MTPPRKARVWTVADFARHVFGCAGEPSPAQHLRARRMLLRLDRKHAGALLLPRGGPNRSITLYPATLARLEPDLFAPVESLEFRIEEIEEAGDRLAEHVAEVGRALDASDERLTEQIAALARQLRHLTAGRSTAA